MRVPVHPATPAPRALGAAATALSGPCGLAGTASISTGSDIASTNATYTVIHAAILIPGRGDPIRHGAVVLRGAKIAWVGPVADLPAEYSSASPIQVPVALPGLWDVHVHFVGMAISAATLGNPMGAYMPAAPVQGGAVTVADLRNTLLAGYTSVRELGGYGGDLAPLVDSGVLVGPNVHSAMALISMSGGHGDDHAVPYDTVRSAQERGGYIALADGVDECVKTVRLLVRRGARCIKVCSSGGVLSLLDGPEDRQFSDAELAAIVEEAGRSGRAVAAHAIGKDGIMAALRAGVRTIEHGMYLDEEAADLMVEKGAIFVGTHHVVASLMKDVDALPEPLRRKVLQLVDKAESSYRLAVAKGVRIALGTDTMSSDPSQALRHGNNARELYWAVKLGLSPLEAIEAATATAAETLGQRGPLSGRLHEGYDADVICLGAGANPLDDIGVLNDPANITHIWKGGKLYKQPGATSESS